MERFGLDGFENEYPHALSGGMRQRTAFLRTVLTDQQMFLLDEPFGALDALSRSQIHEWLLGLWETLGKTIVMVTHSPADADYSHRTIHLFDGQVAAEDLGQRQHTRQAA